MCNDSETGRQTYDVKESVDSRTLREIYLAPWQIMLRKSDPLAVMTAYVPPCRHWPISCLSVDGADVNYIRGIANMEDDEPNKQL